MKGKGKVFPVHK